MSLKSARPLSRARYRKAFHKVERSSLLEGLRTPLAVLFPCICLASIGESIHHGTFALFADSKLPLLLKILVGPLHPLG
ncbi:MAG: hypothetical protein PHX14_11230 [Syntrophomonadaceae bacterium]|nr:hypothetical protein [Syntrophomonadaceae bacterium]